VGHLFQGRFHAILVERDTHLLELCRYVVLNPVRAKAVAQPGGWAWSSYGATAGDVPAPRWLTTEWVLHQFGSRRARAQKQYREFVREGLGGPSPWQQLQGQIYLGSEAFVARHQPGGRVAEIPRRQTLAVRPGLGELLGQPGSHERRLLLAYRRYGYRLQEIADYLGVHYATVSRRLARAERGMAPARSRGTR
jgi:hypothetical protein